MQHVPEHDAECPDAHSQVAHEQDDPSDVIVMIPAPGEPPVHVRPPASELMERLRRMQMQQWS